LRRLLEPRQVPVDKPASGAKTVPLLSQPLEKPLQRRPGAEAPHDAEATARAEEGHDFIPQDVIR
jgi:hypothetical protein